MANYRRMASRTLRKVTRAFPSSPEAVRGVLSLLTPQDVGIPLIRVGPDGDGGYLIPNDLEGVSLALSPGVDDQWGFERDLGHRFGIRSSMCDGSVEAPLDLTALQTFQQVWLSPRPGSGRITLREWVQQQTDQESCDLLLQMDIEGAEYRILKSVDDLTLRHFRIIVVEFHGLDLILNRVALQAVFAPAFRKLHDVFVPVHVHPNNASECVEYQGLMIPKVLEVTYLRRDRAPRSRGLAKIPHPSDARSDPCAPDHRLWSGWPAKRALRDDDQA